MIKRIAILAVAGSWLLGAHVLPSDTPPASRGERLKALRPTAKPTFHSASYPVASVKPTKAQKKRVKRRRRWWNPWRVSSYGDPTAGDDPAGEDPAVRATAVEALGNWNGAIVVADPNTGRILSAVNQKLALSSAFTPCSTFKPVVALAALKEGLITAETELRVGRRKRMNLTEALAHSNNRFFTKLGRMLGFSRLAKYARDFGLGKKVGLDIPGEAPGSFPPTPPKEGDVGLMSSYGRDIEVTALQLAAMLSAFANGGTLPYLQYPRSTEEAAQLVPRARRHLDDLAQYLPLVREGLGAAVLYGTARSAYDPEEQIYGKTGSCSKDGARLGWFASFSSGQQPRYVVVVLLRGGRLMYGPHAAEIAARVYRGLRQKEQAAAQASPATVRVNGLNP